MENEQDYTRLQLPDRKQDAYQGSCNGCCSTFFN